MRQYGSAWADLGKLLRATGRTDEGEEVLRAGATAGVVECMLPLANVLSRRGERAESEQLYRRAFDLGDGHAAWNLATTLQRRVGLRKPQSGAGGLRPTATKSPSGISSTRQQATNSEQSLIISAPAGGSGLGR